MRPTRDEALRTKHGLLKLFEAQLTLLCERSPDDPGLAKMLVQVTALAAAGPGASSPPHLSAAALRMGVRDFQDLLESDVPVAVRLELRRRLRAMAGAALDGLEAEDETKLAAIVARDQVRNEAEYFLVRSAIDRLESGVPRDESRLAVLYRLADAASMA